MKKFQCCYNIQKFRLGTLHKRKEWNCQLSRKAEDMLAKTVRDNRPAGKRLPEIQRKR